MQTFEQTLDSREVAEMVEKNHKELLRDLKRYINQILEGNEKYPTERKIAPSEFFKESEYTDSTGRTLPCYRITKKGCEFIAHKLTGTKGTIFTARYINRFHEMQKIISQHEPEPELPWFIRKFKGKYIVLWRDFTEITGINIVNYKPRNWHLIIPGSDFNGWGWKCNNDEFNAKYGFDYGTDSCMMFFYPHGAIKVLQLLSEEKKMCLKPEAYKTLIEGIHTVQKSEKEVLATQSQKSRPVLNENISVRIKDLPIRVNIVLEQEAK